MNQEIEPDTDRGEVRFYSTDSTGKIIKSSIKFLNDGSIETIIDPAGKFTMTFSPTNKIEFSASGMKITTPAGTYNALTHIHPTGTGPSGPPTPNT